MKEAVHTITKVKIDKEAIRKQDPQVLPLLESALIGSGCKFSVKGNFIKIKADSSNPLKPLIIKVADENKILNQDAQAIRANKELIHKSLTKLGYKVDYNKNELHLTFYPEEANLERRQVVRIDVKANEMALNLLVEALRNSLGASYVVSGKNSVFVKKNPDDPLSIEFNKKEDKDLVLKVLKKIGYMVMDND